MFLKLQNYYITTFYSTFHKNDIEFIGHSSKRNKHETNIRYKEFHSLIPYRKNYMGSILYIYFKYTSFILQILEIQ